MKIITIDIYLNFFQRVLDQRIMYQHIFNSLFTFLEIVFTIFLCILNVDNIISMLDTNSN